MTGLNTSFVLPSFPTPQEASAAKKGSPSPCASYYHEQKVSRATVLTRALEESLAGAEGLFAEAQRSSLAKLPASTALASILDDATQEVPPNLILKIEALSDVNDSLAWGLTSQGNAAAGDNLYGEGEEFVAWIYPGQVALLEVYDLRMEVEATAGPRAAKELIEKVLWTLHPIMASWEPMCAMQYVEATHWMGFGDDRERVWEIQCELAKRRGCEPEDVPVDEAREEGEGFFYTTPQVNDLVPEAWQTAQRRENLTWGKLRANLPAREKAPRAHQIIAEAEEEAIQILRFSKTWGFDWARVGAARHASPAMPWSLVTLPGPEEPHEGFNGLVAESFDEEQNHALEAGRIDVPVAGLVFDPATEKGRGRLRQFLAELKQAGKACRCICEKLSPGCFEKHPFNDRPPLKERQKARRNAGLSAAPLPAGYRSGPDVLKSKAVRAGSVLAALSGRGRAASTLPVGAVPSFY